jgi:Ca2+-binding EF-hand superfamily protein
LFEHVDDDGSGSITREEFVEVFAKIVPGISEQEHEDNSNQTIVTKSDLSLLFDFFDADGNGDLEYTEFAYQFYNRRKVSERMKDKQNINGGKY